MEELGIKICKVCRVPLKGDNKAILDNSIGRDTVYCDLCLDHAKYHNIFLIDIVSENLGFVEKRKDRVCGVCKNDLTDQEIQYSLQKNSIGVHCKNHIDEYYRVFDLDGYEKNKIFLKNKYPNEY